MTVYSSRIIIRAAQDWNLPVNDHIKVRKDVHFNILSNYAKSVLYDRYVAKQFINYVKELQSCRKEASRADPRGLIITEV